MEEGAVGSSRPGRKRDNILPSNDSSTTTDPEPPTNTNPGPAMILDIDERLVQSMTDLLPGIEGKPPTAARKRSKSPRGATRGAVSTLFQKGELTLEDKFNEKLFHEMKWNLQSHRKSHYQKLAAIRAQLPSYTHREAILNCIRSDGNNAIVITGKTGCGKTTQVAQYILDDYINKRQGSKCRIVCTQPRRLSAISVARRVSFERGEQCGNENSTGYMIRFESMAPRRRASILYCTTGILLSWLASDSLLTTCSHVIIDEVHERDVDSDFALTLLKKLLIKRPDLKVILMSATVNANIFSKYFDCCKVFEIPGSTYNVKTDYLENVMDMISYQPEDPERKKSTSSQAQRQLEDYIDELRKEGNLSTRTLESLKNYDHHNLNLDIVLPLIHHICLKLPPGGILVFVPGWYHISQLVKQLDIHPLLRNRRKFSVIPLYADMPINNRRELFEKLPTNVIKIVIATNIAETSLTVHDIVYVIDTGYMNVMRHNVDTGLNSLRPEWTSQANSTQRKGRAGRVADGYCFHLFTKMRHETSPDFATPAILRISLADLCLKIKRLGLGKIAPILEESLEPPSIHNVEKAIESLKSIDALDDDENMTPLGSHLASLPLEPCLGKMILYGAIFSCLDPVLTVAACLSWKEPFVRPLGRDSNALECAFKQRLANSTNSDHFLYINALKKWEGDESFTKHNKESLRNVKVQREDAREDDDDLSDDTAECWEDDTITDEEFVSNETMKMIRNIKTQCCTYLMNLGFAATNNPKQQMLNKHSSNIAFVKAVLCVGLSPRVAKIKGPKKLNVRGVGNVLLHPKSVMRLNDLVATDNFIIYYQLIETQGNTSLNKYIHEGTIITKNMLLFFGGGFHVDEGSGHVTTVGGYTFYTSSEIASLLQRMMSQFKLLLQDKLESPSVAVWKKNSTESKLMEALIEISSHTVTDQSVDSEED